MRNRIHSVIALGVGLALAGCCPPEKEKANDGKVFLNCERACDIDSSGAHGHHTKWELRDSKQNGALFNARINTNDHTIQWILRGTNLSASNGFSIVVLDKYNWKIQKGATNDWRNDAACPFNGANMGVVDSVTNESGMTVMLTNLFLVASSDYKTNYLIVCPPVPSTARISTKGNDPDPAIAPYQFSMLEATMIWDSSLFTDNAIAPKKLQ